MNIRDVFAHSKMGLTSVAVARAVISCVTANTVLYYEHFIYQGPHAHAMRAIAIHLAHVAVLISFSH